MADTINNAANILDSRDIIARIEDLRSDRDDYTPDGTKTPNPEAWALDDPDGAEELAALEKLADQCEGYGDWEYGETLIADSYFTSYAEELAEDIGAIKRDAEWPLRHIDWEAAAEELKADYMAVDFDGETFWMRA